jgi:hypothetical protein
MSAGVRSTRFQRPMWVIRAAYGFGVAMLEK